MSVQVIIGFYAIICLMMIIFNLSYLQIENIRNWYLSRQTMYLSKELQEEIARNLEFPTDEHRDASQEAQAASRHGIVRLHDGAIV